MATARQSKTSTKASKTPKLTKQSSDPQKDLMSGRNRKVASRQTTSRSKAPPQTKVASSATTPAPVQAASPPILDTAASLFRPGSKGAAVVELLGREDGTTVAEIISATGWQAHSVRGFLSGSLRKKLGLGVTSMKGTDGERRYRIAS